MNELLSGTTRLLRIVFGGDTSFGESYQTRLAEQGRENVLATRGYRGTIRKLAPLLTRADCVIANLETPLTPSATPPRDPEQRYVHWADARRTAAVLHDHNVHALSLANNHAMDRGQAGLSDTLAALGQRGIVAFGAGHDRSAAAQPFARAFVLGDTVFPLIVCAGNQGLRAPAEICADTQRGGLNKWNPRRAAEQIAAVRDAYADAFLVAFPHWGTNYRWRKPRQERLAHALIDAGADLVLGHGAHMVQEIECYRGRWILYSLGNLLLNSPGRYRKRAEAVPFSLAAQLEASERDSGLDITLRVYPIFSDNRVTRYRPRLVTEEEMQRVEGCLLERSPNPSGLRACWRRQLDEIGLSFSIALGRMAERRATRLVAGLTPADRDQAAA